MRVLIFEPQYAGHNLAYVHHISERLLELGCEVHLVTSSQALDSEEFTTHLGDILRSIHVIGLNSFSRRHPTGSIRVNGPSGLLGLWRSLDKGLKAVRPQHLFVPFGNPLASLGGIPNPVSHRMVKHSIEAEIVLLSGKYAHPHRTWVSRCKERLALAILERGPWARIHHIVPHAVRTMKNFSPRLASLASLLPDPVDKPPSMSREQARRCLGIPSEGRIVSLAGLLEPRKGVGELLAAFEEIAGDTAPSDRLLLAGKATPAIRALLTARYSTWIANGRILFLDRHLTHEELWAACIAADLVCTPYPYHLFSASIVIRAARVGVPVLANSIGWMEQTIPLFGLGRTCDTLNLKVFAKSLLTSLDASATHRISAVGERFLAFHTPENFADRLTHRVAERMGCENHRPGLSWEEVLPGSYESWNERVAPPIFC
jgi:glycosyltransferase involved in cell wall biosynthesis